MADSLASQHYVGVINNTFTVNHSLNTSAFPCFLPSKISTAKSLMAQFLTAARDKLVTLVATQLPGGEYTKESLLKALGQEQYDLLYQSVPDNATNDLMKGLWACLRSNAASCVLVGLTCWKE